MIISAYFMASSNKRDLWKPIQLLAQVIIFSTMKEDNQVKSNSMIFEYLGIISFVVTAFVCALAYPLFKILFTEQYLSGYIVAPYLLLAPLLQMLFQVACNQFIVVKKTWPNMFILSMGAVANIAINYFLIPVLGIEGASLATLMGYAISDMICVIVLCKMKLMVVEKKFIAATLGMILFFVIWRLFIPSDTVLGLGLELSFCFYLLFLYRSDANGLVSMMRRN